MVHCSDLHTVCNGDRTTNLGKVWLITPSLKILRNIFSNVPNKVAFPDKSSSDYGDCYTLSKTSGYTLQEKMHSLILKIIFCIGGSNI